MINLFLVSHHFGPRSAELCIYTVDQQLVSIESLDTKRIEGNDSDARGGWNNHGELSFHIGVTFISSYNTQQLIYAYLSFST